MVRVQHHSFVCGYPVVSAPFTEKTVLSPWSWHPCENHLSIYARAYFWALYSIPLVYISVFMPVPLCFDYPSFVLTFEIRNCESSNFILLFSIVFVIQGPLGFHMNFRMDLSISVKNVIGILIGIALNLQITLGSMDILTTLKLPIHEHRIYFHLFVSSLISFSNIL